MSNTGTEQNSVARDFIASLVVFLVALPLCMGIAIASGVPPALGLATGVIGGLVVGAISGSPLQVSGPAAGLAIVVFGSHDLAPGIEAAIDAAGAPPAVLGIVIGFIVLLPESLAALKAALADRLQISLNLAIGSALATIGLTIPTVAALSLINGWTLALGLDLRGMILLFLSLMVATLSLGTGRTTVLQGTVHLVIFAVYLFTAFVP